MTEPCGAARALPATEIPADSARMSFEQQFSTWRRNGEFDALIEGYRQHRDLPDAQVAQMPLFFAARGFTYLGWVHTRSETQTAKELSPMLAEKACALAREYLGR